MGSGVPQGSVLGPQAFIAFINNIDLVCNFIKLMNKFTDAAKAANTILTDKDVEDLQDCLNRLVTWADTWGMEFNVTKCKVMHVGRNNPRSDFFMSATRLTPTEALSATLVRWSITPSGHLHPVFRIRIRLDPYHLAGSGSNSGNLNPDPGSKKKHDKLT